MNRELLHGDYCSKRKRYYNNDTGKWITRKLTSMHSEQRKLLVYDFHVCKREYLKEIFEHKHLNRVSYFLTYLYRAMINEERNVNQWVYISADFNRLMLTNDWSALIDVLIDLDIIEVNKPQRSPYNRNKFKSYYRLKSNVYSSKYDKHYITHSKLFKSIKSKRKKSLSADVLLEYEQNVFANNVKLANKGISSLFSKRVQRKRAEDLSKLTWDTIGERRTKEIQNRLDRIGFNTKTRTEYFDRFEKRFNVLQDKIEISKSSVEDIVVSKHDFGDRFYNPIITIDREFRELIYLDNQPTVEVDMVTGYSSLFYTLLHHLTHNIRTIVPKQVFDEYYKNGKLEYYFDEFLDDFYPFFDGGKVDFYQAVGYQIRNRITNIKNIDKISSPIASIGLTSYTKEDRNYIKDLLIRIINSNPLHHSNTSFIDKTFSFDELQSIIFSSHVKDFLNDIKSKKIFKRGVKKRNANITKVLITMEQRIMRMLKTKLVEQGIPYISLHDGVLVGEKNKEFTLSYCNQISNKFPFIHFKSK